MSERQTTLSIITSRIPCALDLRKLRRQRRCLVLPNKSKCMYHELSRTRKCGEVDSRTSLVLTSHLSLVRISSSSTPNWRNCRRENLRCSRCVGLLISAGSIGPMTALRWIVARQRDSCCSQGATGPRRYSREVGSGKDGCTRVH